MGPDQQSCSVCKKSIVGMGMTCACFPSHGIYHKECEGKIPDHTEKSRWDGIGLTDEFIASSLWYALGDIDATDARMLRATEAVKVILAEQRRQLTASGDATVPLDESAIRKDEREKMKKMIRSIPPWPEPQPGAGEGMGPLAGAGMYMQYEEDRRKRDGDIAEIEVLLDAMD